MEEVITTNGSTATFGTGGGGGVCVCTHTPLLAVKTSDDDDETIFALHLYNFFAKTMHVSSAAAGGDAAIGFFIDLSSREPM